MCSEAAALLMIQHMLRVFEVNVIAKLKTDSSSAKLISQRTGLGKLKHLEIKMLWLQDQVKRKALIVQKESTETNIGDLGTKPLLKERFDRLCDMIGIRQVSTELLERAIEKPMAEDMNASKQIGAINISPKIMSLCLALTQVIGEQSK